MACSSFPSAILAKYDLFKFYEGGLEKGLLKLN